MAVDIETVINSMPAHLQKLCRLLKSESLGSAAQILGITRQVVRRQIATIESRFRSAGIHEYL